MHAIGDWLASLLGTASVPALVAAIAWKYREKIWAMIERAIAARLDKVVMSTEFGQRVKSIETKLEELSARRIR